MCLRPQKKTYILLLMYMSLETFASSLHMYTLWATIWSSYSIAIQIRRFPTTVWICLMSSKMEASRIEECMCTKNIWHTISYNLNIALTTNTSYLTETSRMTGNFHANLYSYVYSFLWFTLGSFTPHMQYVFNAYIICWRTMMLIEPTLCWCWVALQCM